jgi:ABC-type cobalamin/Fe3+-siderophores transport system ATPase subunit
MPGQPAVEVVNGSFAWQRGEAPLLRGVSLAVPRGALVVVVGAVGSGKSSLLAALLGEMVALDGRVAVRGSTAYTQQDPFIQVGARWHCSCGGSCGADPGPAAGLTPLGVCSLVVIQMQSQPDQSMCSCREASPLRRMRRCGTTS